MRHHGKLPHDKKFQPYTHTLLIYTAMAIPQDPMMLFSYINTKLRDDYNSIDALCDDLHLDRKELESKLGSAGFEYNETQNKFW